MSVVNIEIGQRIVDARKVVGVSQRELANETGLSQPTIQRIEKGARANRRRLWCAGRRPAWHEQHR